MRRFKSHWISRKEADGFIARHHRHHPPVHAAITQIGLWEGERLVGVSVLGQPLARHLAARNVVEVTRLCVMPDVRHAASSLLGATRRLAQVLGFDSVVTYTLQDEGGASLRAAGFQADLELIGGYVWDTPSRRRATPLAPTARRVRWWATLKQQRELEL